MSFRASVLLVLLGTSSLPAQGPGDDVEKLRAEIIRLREDNSRLRDTLKQILEGAAEAKKIEGAWVIDSARLDGTDVASDKGGEIEFIGNSVIARMPGRQDPVRLEFVITPSAKQLDFRPILRSVKDNYRATGTSLDRMIGRYEWAGNQLRVSLQSAYIIPSEISDKGQVLWILKRKQ